MKLVVLGRDGVINQAVEGGITQADQWQPLPASAEAIARLSRAGYRVVVTTNQQALSEETLTIEALHDIHEKMHSVIGEAGGTIDSVFIAASGDPKARGKRQPKAKLLKEVEERYSVSMKDVTVIGDSMEDLEAAGAVGAKAILVRTGDGTDMLAALTSFEGVTTYKDLASTVDAILSR